VFFVCESLIGLRFKGSLQKRLLLFSKELSRAPFFGKPVLRLCSRARLW